MTDNPFGAEGGFDLQAMLQQAQQMQSQLVEAQERLATAEVEGSAGGVRVTLTGTGDLTAVTIDPASVDASDADALADLGDLVVAAYRDGRARVDALATEALGPLAGGGMDLGGGLGGALGGPPARPTRTGPDPPGASVYEGVLQDLIDELARLPGVGPKGAQRIAFHLLAADPADVRRLADTLVEMKAKATFCQVCGNVSQSERCRICQDPRRDPT